jgi:hypothetical protein
MTVSARVILAFLQLTLLNHKRYSLLFYSWILALYGILCFSFYQIMLEISYTTQTKLNNLCHFWLTELYVSCKTSAVGLYRPLPG